MNKSRLLILLSLLLTASMLLAACGGKANVTQAPT